VWSVPRLHNEIPRVTSGLDTKTDRLIDRQSQCDFDLSSTVTLRVAGGDEKGSLKSEAVKYGSESQGNRTRE
jgi:hypothetical protein